MLNVDGFTLSEINKNMWVFTAEPGVAFTGSFKEVIVFAMYRYRFQLKEIERATRFMIEMNHNTAIFGMMGVFAYSCDVQSVEGFKQEN